MRVYGFLGSVLVVSAASALVCAQGGPLSTTFTNWIDHPTIGYRSTPAGDPVSQLNQALPRPPNQALQPTGGRLQRQGYSHRPRLSAGVMPLICRTRTFENDSRSSPDVNPLM